MIRFAWRQMRLPAVSTAILLATLATILALTERAMTSFLHDSGLSSCLAGGGTCNGSHATAVMVSPSDTPSASYSRAGSATTEGPGASEAESAPLVGDSEVIERNTTSLLVSAIDDSAGSE